jgi:hypothetical protein
VKLLFLALLLASFAARADLYRWIDRESGSVKYSNAPPPWYGDPDKERNAPAVEILRYKTPAKPVPEISANARTIAGLEARRAELVRFLATIPPATDVDKAGIRRQLDDYQALSAELDRLDPAGATRRRAQQPPIVEVAAARRPQ